VLLITVLTTLSMTPLTAFHYIVKRNYVRFSHNLLKIQNTDT
jgi:hypothetical protein